MNRRLGAVLGTSLWFFGYVLGAASPVAAAATLTVNRIGDSADLSAGDGKCDVSTTNGNQCTLRAAIQEANALAGSDTINFNITSTSKVIAPAGQLPQITESVTINGYTQSGASQNTKAVGNDAVLKIVLDGVNAGANAIGLRIPGNEVTVRGLVIQRWKGAAISITGNNTIVAGNFIGTNAAGNAARANTTGIVLGGVGHAIGGISVSARNLISGNVGGAISADGLTGSVIAGNYIGTNKGGTAALANSQSGIVITNSSLITIGGNDGTPGNLISGNDRNAIACTDSHDLRIQGNLIGTDAAGLNAIAQGDRGLNFTRCHNNQIGGTSAIERNTISSCLTGIDLTLSDGNTLEGNRIGTRSDGTGNLGNRFGGIHVAGANNRIGGAGAAGNVIANTLNDADGIFIAGNNATGNVIQGNSIVANTGDGIKVWRPTRSWATRSQRMAARA